MVKERVLAALKVATMGTTLCVAIIAIGIILSSIIVYILQYIGITDAGVMFFIIISVLTVIITFIGLFIAELLAND